VSAKQRRKKKPERTTFEVTPICKVARERRATCIFGPNSPLSAARMREVTRSWAGGNGHQICHHFGSGEAGSRPGDEDFEGEDVWCRGFYDTQTPESVKELMRDFESVGLVRLVGEPPKDNEPRE
jgi:hypothetical protein